MGAARPEHRAGTDDQPRPVDHQRLGDGDVVVGQGRRQAVERVARRVGRGTREDDHLPAGLRDPEVGAHGRTDPGERCEQARVRVRREQHRERELHGPRQPGTHHDQLEVGALAAPGHRPGHPAHRAVEVGRRVQHDADPPRLARPVLRGRPVDEVALQDRRRPAGVVVRRVRRAVEQHPGHERHRRRRGQLDQQVQGLGPAERLVETAGLGHHLQPGDERGQVDVLVREQVVAAAVDGPVRRVVASRHPHRGMRHRGAVRLQVAEHHRQEVGVPGVVGVDERDVLPPGAGQGRVARPGQAAPRHRHRHDARLERCDAGQHGGRVVGRAVVDDDQLPAAVRLCLDRVHHGAQPRPVVADGQDHGDQGLVAGLGQRRRGGLRTGRLLRTALGHPDVVGLRPPLGRLEGGTAQPAPRDLGDPLGHRDGGVLARARDPPRQRAVRVPGGVGVLGHDPGHVHQRVRRGAAPGGLVQRVRRAVGLGIEAARGGVLVGGEDRAELGAHPVPVQQARGERVGDVRGHGGTPPGGATGPGRAASGGASRWAGAGRRRRCPP